MVNSLKVNVKDQLEFELTFYDFAVEHVIHCARGTQWVGSTVYQYGIHCGHWIWILVRDILFWNQCTSWSLSNPDILTVRLILIKWMADWLVGWFVVTLLWVGLWLVCGVLVCGWFALGWFVVGWFTVVFFCVLVWGLFAVSWFAVGLWWVSLRLFFGVLVCSGLVCGWFVVGSRWVGLWWVGLWLFYGVLVCSWFAMGWFVVGWFAVVFWCTGLQWVGFMVGLRCVMIGLWLICGGLVLCHLNPC